MHQSETAAERQIQPRSVGLCSHLFTLFVQLFQPNSAVILGNAEPCRPSAKEPGRKENKDCIIFRKQGNCECIATWGRPSHALSRFNHDAKLEVAEPVPCSIMAFCCWYITLRCDLTFDLRFWTFAAYRLWRDATLYQIWTQLNNPRQNYCDFSVWPYDLKHCVTCCARLCDNFHQVWPLTTYPCLNYIFFDADTLYHAVTLTFGQLTLKVCGTSSVTWSKSVRNLSKIEQSRLNYW